MKTLALATITALMMTSIHAMEPIPAQDLGLPRPIAGKIRIVTKNESVHHVRIPPKIKLLRSNPHRLTAIRFGHVNPIDAPDDEYLCSGTVRRPKVINEPAEDQELSAHVRMKLMVARVKAVKRHQEIWA